MTTKNDEVILSRSKSVLKNASYYFGKAIKKLNQENEKDDEENAAKRYSLYPILDEKSYHFYERQEHQHWSAGEFDYHEDCKSYALMNNTEKFVIDNIVGAFILGDGGIIESVLRFLVDGGNTLEDRAMLISQLHIELIHSETYSLASEAFKGQGGSIDSITSLSCPPVDAKIRFSEKWVSSDSPKWQRLVANSIIEGIFFISGFAGIFYFRSKNKLPNFVLANELISKDETLHRDYNVHLAIRSMDGDITTEKEKIIREMVSDGVNVECEFAKHLMSKGELNDFNFENLQTYIKLLADVLLDLYGLSKQYNVTNPFTWLNDLAFEQKTNFYEKKVGAYVKRSLKEVTDWKKRAGIGSDTTQKINVADPDNIDF